MTIPFCKLQPPDDVSLSFVMAVKSRKADEVDQLLQKNQSLRDNINECWFDFDSPAIVNANNSEAVIKILLKHGANINQRTDWWAGSFGVLDGAPTEMVPFLVDRGAKFDIHSAAEHGKAELVAEFIERDPALVNSRGGDGQTPLHVASTIAICETLIDAGADLTIRCLDHSATAAQYAVSDPEKCRHLIMRGATPDIFMACAIGDRELVEQLIREEPESLSYRVGHCPHTSAKIHLKSHSHIYQWKLLGARTPLEVAREFDQSALYEALYSASPPAQQFIAACWEADRVRAQAVLEKAPDIIQTLAPWQQTEMARAAWEGKLESVRLMLELGFDPHLPGPENSTPIDRAAFHGFREIVELLLENDSDPPLTFKNQYGGTPLSCCAYGATHSWKQNTDHFGTCLALIASGAKIDPEWLPIENKKIDKLFRDELGI